MTSALITKFKPMCYFQILRTSLMTVRIHNVQYCHSRIESHKLTFQRLSQNLSLITNDSMRVKYDKKLLKLEHQRSKPLTVIFAWLLSKEEHLQKIAEVYTTQGFDVLIARITPWELLFPEKGVLLAAQDTVRFLLENDSYSSIVLHGFSVGGFLWCEMMVHMATDLEKHQPLINRFQAQIWDSLVGVKEMPFGVAYALFPGNRALQLPIETALEYHMKIFKKSATLYYERSIPTFLGTLVTAPALFFVSKSDVLGAEKLCLTFRENWPTRGISVTWKCWDTSPHAGHFVKHRQEYLEMLFCHLRSAGLLLHSKL